MRKIISIIMIAMMLVSMTAISVNAEQGQLLFADSFDYDNELNWLLDSSAFACEDGWLKGDHSAVVHQSNYLEEFNGNKKWGTCSFSVDIAFYDYSVNSDDYSAGLWWMDYEIPEWMEYFPGDPIETGTTYWLRIFTESRRVALIADFASMVEETTLAEGETETGEPMETSIEVASYDLPADFDLTVDYTNPTIINLGMRVESQKISVYLDGKKIMEYVSPTILADKNDSPILLVNGGLMIGFDNFKVATVDYPLFAADSEPQPTDPVPSDTVASDVTPPESSIVTETKVVTDTDDSGNIVSSVVVESSVVTAPPTANTNPAPSVGGNSTATGDMAFMVVAVMVVALGTAIVVRKVNVK